MSKEVKSDLFRDGLSNGAKAFLVKPIMADDVRDMWQLCELRKVNLNDNTRRSLAHVPSAHICSSFISGNSHDKPTSKKSLIDIYKSNSNSNDCYELL